MTGAMLAWATGNEHKSRTTNEQMIISEGNYRICEFAWDCENCEAMKQSV